MTTVKAVKAEALQQDPDKPVLVREVTVQYKGTDYTVRGDTLDDVELLEYIEDEQYIKALRRMVGLAQWAKFKDSVRTDTGRVPTAELEEFLKTVMDALDPTTAS